MYPIWIANNKENYKYILKNNKNYSKDISSWEKSFFCNSDKSDKNLSSLLETYHLKRLVVEQSDLKTCLKAMEWTFHQLMGKVQENIEDIVAGKILKFCKKTRSGVNCLCHATVLTEILLALGYRARKISCCPIDVVPYDNHVVTTVYVPSLKKWIMLDPSMCCYIQANNSILSIAEIRENLIQNRKMDVITYNRFTIACNGFKKTLEFNTEEYITYLYKNFFRFLSREIQSGCKTQKDDVVYMLVPKGYLPANYVYKDFFENEMVEIRITDNDVFFWNGIYI